MGNRVDWLSWLGDPLGDARDGQVHDDAQESGEHRDESVLSTTVLWHLDELLDDPANEIIPAERSRKGETGDNRVEGLGFQFLGHETNSVESGVHCVLYTLAWENYSGRSSSSYIRLYFLRPIGFLD